MKTIATALAQHEFVYNGVTYKLRGLTGRESYKLQVMQDSDEMGIYLIVCGLCGWSGHAQPFIDDDIDAMLACLELDDLIAIGEEVKRLSGLEPADVRNLASRLLSSTPDPDAATAETIAPSKAPDSTDGSIPTAQRETYARTG